MKKRLFVLLTAAALLVASVALGEQSGTRVFDNVGVFSAGETEALEAAIADFQESTGYDFAVLITDEDCGYDDYQSLCHDFAQNESLGLGMNNTLILCYLDLYGDEYYYYYYVSVFGDLAYLMADSEIEYLTESAMDYISYGDVAGGFEWTMEFLSRALTNIGTDNPSWRVFDFADILSDAETETLEAAIAEFRALSGMDFIYLSSFEEMDGNEDGDYMEEFYLTHGFGDGENHSGAMIYLDLYRSNYYVQNFGDMADVISFDSLDVIIENVTELMNEGEVHNGVLQIISDYSAYFR